MASQQPLRNHGHPELGKEDVSELSFGLLKDSFKLIDSITLGLGVTMAKRWSKFVIWDHLSNTEPGFSFLDYDLNGYEDIGIGPFMEILAVSRTQSSDSELRISEKRLIEDHDFEKWIIGIKELEKNLMCLMLMYFSGTNSRQDLKFDKILIRNTNESKRNLFIQTQPNHALFLTSPYTKIPWLLSELILRHIFMIIPIRTFIEQQQQDDNNSSFMSCNLFNTPFHIQHDFIGRVVDEKAPDTNITSIQQWNTACEHIQYENDWKTCLFGTSEFNFNIYVRKLNRISLFPIIGSWDIVPTPDSIPRR